MNDNDRAELGRLLDEQRSLVVDKKAIEQQLVQEPELSRGSEWETRAKSAVARIDKRLSSIKYRMVQLDPSGTQRGSLGKKIEARVFINIQSAFDAARTLNEITSENRILGFQVIDGKMVVLLETKAQ